MPRRASLVNDSVFLSKKEMFSRHLGMLSEISRTLIDGITMAEI